jgi:hypothetical protein
MANRKGCGCGSLLAGLAVTWLINRLLARRRASA